MDRIARSHEEFRRAWDTAQAAALGSICPKGAASLEQIWQANAIAYKAAEPLSRKRDQFLASLFSEHFLPLHQAFSEGVPDAVHAIIDFLEVDVPAYQCGYAKETCLRKLKTVPLTDEHHQRLRHYGIWLCSLPRYRREFHEAARLMIRVADKTFVEQLRTLACGGNGFASKRATRILGIVLNSRMDLRPQEQNRGGKMAS